MYVMNTRALEKTENATKNELNKDTALGII